MSASPLRVRVPASTSNLGPGFDLLGVALSLRLEVHAVPGGSGLRLASLAGEAETWPRRDNLLLRAFEEARGADARGWSFEVASEIPICRGLGSSAAAVAAGLLLGAAAGATNAPRAELLARGLALEGHPDNIAPALFGGARLCVPRAHAGPHLLCQTVHPSLGWAVAWPEVQVSTGVARAALPAQVAFDDAVENPRRLALLLDGLRGGDPERIADGLADRLHAAYRLALVPGADTVLAAAREAGAFGATVSGSGSAHVAIGPRARMAEVAEAMAAAWRSATGTGRGTAVEVVGEAPAVEPSE
ncbi:MAG: homoserine kinase [Planctomycetota bacterium]